MPVICFKKYCKLRVGLSPYCDILLKICSMVEIIIIDKNMIYNNYELLIIANGTNGTNGSRSYNLSDCGQDHNQEDCIIPVTSIFSNPY